MERALGELINILNPYSNPKCEPPNKMHRMQFAIFCAPGQAADGGPGQAAPADGGPGQAAPANGGPGQAAPAGHARHLAQIAVEIDNYQGGEWTFMGQMYKIKRGLLIPYRYQVLGGKDCDKPTGVWAVGNLLIGYTGANGG